MDTNPIFEIRASDGPCMCSAAARSRIGIKPGDMVRIVTERSEICRRVYKVPEMALPVAGPGVMWLNVLDMQLIGAVNGEEVIVTKSEESEEMP